VTRVDELKQVIAKVLEDDQANFGRLFEAANELAQLDESEVRFTVDAAIINRLGRELVARQETAVSELVKNAYDADATGVTLTFTRAETSGGSLLIADDGHGMSREDLINGFMRLSSQDKVLNPVSPRFKRQRAGRKGIGRFAAQRLGSALTITTQTSSNNEALQVTLDWTRFSGSSDLVLISTPIFRIAKSRDHGTDLRIENLAEGWSDASITRVYRSLLELIQPFPLSKQRPNSVVDPGFEIRMFRGGARLNSVATVDNILFDQSLAEVQASVKDDGTAVAAISSRSLDVVDSIDCGPNKDGKGTYKHLRNVFLRAYYFIYSPELLPRNQINSIRGLAEEHGGIRLYRNGYRVQPYGEPLNDWLELDRSYSQRVILPPHGNANFFGFIEVTDLEGGTFEETASREGLIQNDAYLELVAFASRTLQAVALRIASARARKTTARQRDWIYEESAASNFLHDAATELRGLAATLPDAISADDPDVSVRDTKRRLEITASKLQRAGEAQAKSREELINEQNMLRVLSSMGLAIVEFTHEVKHILPAVVGDANQLSEGSVPPSKIAEVRGRLTTNTSALRSYTSYFDRAVSEIARRESAPQDVAFILRQFQRVFGPAAARYGIELKAPETEGFELVTCPMHQTEWTSLLLNFFTNSRKAIQRKRSKGLIRMRAGKIGARIFVEFSDNGDGIPAHEWKKVFEPFFTTSLGGQEEGDQEVVTGTGLGLKIVRDIVEAHNGTVEVVSPSEPFATCMRVEIPAATAAELANYDE